MKLEVGKSYRTRDGKRAVVGTNTASVADPFYGHVGTHACTWMEDGTCWDHEVEHHMDLVAEWEEPTLVQTVQQVIEEKEKRGEGEKGAPGPLWAVVAWNRLSNSWDALEASDEAEAVQVAKDRCHSHRTDAFVMKACMVVTPAEPLVVRFEEGGAK